MSKKIEPCPFCGREGVIKEHRYHSLRYFVECGNMDCECSLVYSYETKQEAIRVWNGRIGNKQINKETQKEINTFAKNIAKNLLNKGESDGE